MVYILFGRGVRMKEGVGKERQWPRKWTCWKISSKCHFSPSTFSPVK